MIEIEGKTQGKNTANAKGQINKHRNYISARTKTKIRDRSKKAEKKEDIKGKEALKTSIKRPNTKKGIETVSKERYDKKREREENRNETIRTNAQPKCYYYENSKCTKERCTYRHAVRVCKEYNKNKCNLGKFCRDNHPTKKCNYWTRGYYKWETKCNMKHEENSHDDDDKQHDRVKEHKIRIEQMTKNEKKGFINSNEVTANTMNGANRPQLQQGNMIQGSLNKIKQPDTQVCKAQQTILMPYTQEPPQNLIHQWILPTNLYRGNPLPMFNLQLPI